MVIMMKPESTTEQIDAVAAAVAKSGQKHSVCHLQTAVFVFGDGSHVADLEPFKELSGVTEVLNIQVNIPKPTEHRTVPDPMR